VKIRVHRLLEMQNTLRILHVLQASLRINTIEQRIFMDFHDFLARSAWDVLLVIVGEKRP